MNTTDIVISPNGLHIAKIDPPSIGDTGLSELVMVYTTDGLICMAQYGKDGWWHGEGDETFGNVTHWFDGYPVPAGMRINYSRYGGEI